VTGDFSLEPPTVSREHLGRYRKALEQLRVLSGRHTQHPTPLSARLPKLDGYTEDSSDSKVPKTVEKGLPKIEWPCVKDSLGDYMCSTPPKVCAVTAKSK
jgi:hypothetical protein